MRARLPLNVPYKLRLAFWLRRRVALVVLLAAGIAALAAQSAGATFPGHNGAIAVDGNARGCGPAPVWTAQIADFSDPCDFANGFFILGPGKPAQHVGGPQTCCGAYSPSGRWLVRLTGSCAVVIGPAEAPQRYRRLRAIAPDGRRACVQQVAFSPSGRRLVITYGSQDLASDSIAVVSASGGRIRYLAKGYGPAWSATDRIAFSRFQVSGDRGYETIWTTKPDGTRMREVTQPALPISATWQQFDDQPSWSPHGNAIVFVRLISNGSTATARLGSGLYTVRADGGGLRRLTRSTADQTPLWSPDGRTIAFTRGDHLLAMTPKGRRLHRVARNVLAADDWQPLPG